jgi:hypothetical protein
MRKRCPSPAWRSTTASTPIRVPASGAAPRCITKRRATSPNCRCTRSTAALRLRERLLHAAKARIAVANPRLLQTVTELCISSLLHSHSCRRVKQAAPSSPRSPSKLIDDFTHGLRDWYQLNAGNLTHQQLWTRKVTDPLWRGPDGSKLVLTLKIPQTNRLHIVLQQNEWRSYRGPAARAGKIFHQDVPTHIGADGLDDAESWDEVVNPRGRDKTEEHLLTVHTPDLPLPDQMAYLAAEGTDAEQTDGKVADAAIRLLRDYAAKPFFIAAGFYRPHLPSIAPKKWFDLYALDQTTLPALPTDYRSRVPAAALSSTPVWPNFGTTELQARECILAYEATVSFVDAQIGRVLDALDEMKLADKTIIVLWGDHGFHLGEHGLWRKNSLFEESTRAPLIIAVPGIKGGKTCASPVEFIDIFPTVVESAGLPLPAGLEGVSLLPLLRDPATPHDRPARSMVQFRGVPGRTVRTATWRYTEWGENGNAGTRVV